MSVSNNGVVILVIIGAGFVLLICAAIAQFFFEDSSTETDPFRERSIEQSMYMRNVRQRNLAWAWREARSAANRNYSSSRGNSGQRSGSMWAEAPMQEGSQERYYGYTTSEQTPRGY